VTYDNSEGPSREPGCVCTKTRFIDHANIRAGGNFVDEEIIYCNSVLAVIPVRGNCSGGTGGRKSRSSEKKDGTELGRYEGLADAIKAASGHDNPTFVLLKNFDVGKNINMSNATLNLNSRV